MLACECGRSGPGGIPRSAGTLSFGFSPAAELRAVAPALGATGSSSGSRGASAFARVTLPLPGEFNIANALAAAAVALASA